MVHKGYGANTFPTGSCSLYFPSKLELNSIKHVLDATKQIRKVWQQCFRKQYLVVGGDPWQSINHNPTGPVVILNCGIFIVQDGATAAPILPFKKTEKGWKCMQLTYLDKTCIYCTERFLGHTSGVYESHGLINKCCLETRQSV